MSARTRYRLVSDYGYGDKSWLERDLTAEQAIAVINDRTGMDVETIDAALEADHPIYSIEVDDWEDVEDWDWQDS
jgi:hypothetical protein